METQDIIIGALLFSLVIGVLITFIIAGSTDTGVDTTGLTSLSTFNKTNETLELANTIADTFQGADISSASGVYSLYKTAYGVMKLVFNAIGIVSTIFYDVVNFIGIDPIFASIAIAILTIVVIYAIAKAIWSIR